MSARAAVGDWPNGMAGRDRVLALVKSRVRFRFALDAPAFVDRILRDLQSPDTEGAAPLVDHVGRLCLDDLYLASACALGDEQAWRECASAHFGFIREFASRFLPDADGRDLADQVIADLWQRGKMGRFAGRSTLRTWLGAVVAHAALNARQSRRRRGHDDASPGTEADECVRPEPHDEESAHLLATLVSEAIGALRDDDRLLLLMCYEQGLTLEAIAPLLGASKATLSRRLRRIREELHRAVDDTARRRFSTAADGLRAGVDLSRLELDLWTLLKPRDGVEGDSSRAV